MIRRLALVLTVAALVSGAGLLLRAEPPQAVGTWASIGTAPENRIGAAAVALPDGRTLIAGGLANGIPTDAVVVFDPADGSFTAAGQLAEARTGHTATLLDDGTVLVAGGTVNDILTGDLEIFDPSTGTSTPAASLIQMRKGHAAARLGDGKVLIAGGTGADGVLATAEIFDPQTGAVSPAASPLLVARTGASATALIDGRVLIAGGNNGTEDLRSAEIYNPSTESFQATDTILDVPRSGHTAVLLPHNNSVLIAGGTSNGEGSADLFLPAQFPDPYSYGMGQFAQTNAMAAPRSGAAGGPHIEGYAFVVGGGQGDAEVYRFATIKTDKDDYAPGENAIITGSGWEPNEEVTLLFQEDPAVHTDYMFTVTADSEGNIYHDQWAPEQHDLNVRFYLMARGSRSRAQTTFTDGLKVTVSRNNPNGATINNVQSGATVTVTFEIKNTNNNPDQNTQISGLYTLSYSNLTLQSGGPPASGTFSLLQNGSTTLLTWSFTAPTGPASGSIDLSATITLPTCNDTGSNSCSSSAGYTVSVLAPADSTPPVITPNVNGTLGNNGWYTSNVGVSWTVTDPESSITSTTGCGPTTINTDTAGTTLTCSATSAGGTASQSVTIKRDATAPSITFVGQTPAPNGNGWNNTNVTLEWSCSDGGGSGVVAASVSQVISSEGENQQATGTCTDLAGNTNSSTDGDVNIDKTNPTITFVGQTPAPNGNGWNNTNVTLEWSCSDGGGSGVVAASVSQTISSEGTAQQATGTCTDLAGNTNSSTDGNVNIDKTAPNAPTGTKTPAANAAGWNNTDVTVSFTQNGDAGAVQSGIDSCTASSSVTGETAGTDVNGTCTDKAGNTSAATTVTVKIDKTKPVITGSRAPLANSFGWNNTDVTVSFTCADAGSVQSGIGTNTVLGATVSTEGTNQSVTNTGTCVDQAGNIADSATVSDINIDKTSPNAPTGTKNPLANAAGWNNTNVTVSFANNGDAGTVQSGIDSCTAATTLTSETNGTNVSGTCTDKAGNTSTATVVTVRIDNTAPTVTFVTPPAGSPYLLNQVVAAVFSCGDNLSGFVAGNPVNGPTADCSGAATVDTTLVGDQQFSVTTTDKAGNSTTATQAYSVHYDFTGFFRPVDNLPIVNKVKAGSAIPVKFSLTGNQGLNIFATGYPKSVPVNCETGAPTDDVDETVTAGGSSLSYDLLADQYIYVWKTEKSWANSCRLLTVKLKDGTEHQAKFSFTK